MVTALKISHDFLEGTRQNAIPFICQYFPQRLPSCSGYDISMPLEQRDVAPDRQSGQRSDARIWLVRTSILEWVSIYSFLSEEAGATIPRMPARLWYLCIWAGGAGIPCYV